MELTALAVRRETHVLQAVSALAVLDSCIEELVLIPLGMHPSARSIVRMVRALSLNQLHRLVHDLLLLSTDNDKPPCTIIATSTLVLT